MVWKETKKYTGVITQITFFFQVDLEADREVSVADGNTLANDWGCPFFETSAKNKKNVDQLFAEIVRETNYMSHPQRRGGCCIVL